jgi:hypothetical protein
MKLEMRINTSSPNEEKYPKTEELVEKIMKDLEKQVFHSKLRFSQLWKIEDGTFYHNKVM